MFSQPTLHFQNLHRRIDLIQEVSGSLLEVVPLPGLTTRGHPDKECFILAQKTWSIVVWSHYFGPFLTDTPLC